MFLTWGQLFNQYADPLGYFEICLEIFQTADFRNTAEINKCWEAIIRKGDFPDHSPLVSTSSDWPIEHEGKERRETGEPFEGVADAIRRLGRRLLKYELIFNPPTLVPMVEKYNLETIQRDGWVPEAFLDAGTPHP
jgi:nuclear pore complex protein Nup155